LKLSRILLPVDFSERGAGAAREAAGLARHFGAELTLLHVNPFIAPTLTVPREFGGTIDTGWITALEAARRRELASYQAAQFRDVTLKQVVVTGDPAPCIVEYAHHEKTDLVVMPTHGYGPFRRFLLGSVTAKVLHDVECPVWTGAHLQDGSAAEWKPPKRVFCAVDGRAGTERILSWASNLACEFSAQLTIVHVMPTLEASEALDPGVRTGRIEAAVQQIRCLQKKSGVAGALAIEFGDVAKAVSEAAERGGADLVVIGRSPAEGVLGRLRTNAYSLIRESRRPVVSV